MLPNILKHPCTGLTLALFTIWFLFNKSKITALGLFDGKPGHLYTSSASADIIGGLIIHGVIFCLCACVGFFIGAIVKSLIEEVRSN